LTDLSIIVTAHAEGVMLGATLRSAKAAVTEAQQAGFSCELLLGLDCASSETRQIAKGSAAADWARYDVEFADPFLTRNSMIKMASGRWVALIDGDDLVSANWLAHAAARLAAEPPGTVVHPELNVIFDRQRGAFLKIEPTEALFLPEVFYFENYYDLMALAPRDIYLRYPFRSRDLVAGYGFQDWEWAIETLAAGVPHVVAKDTIVFKRRRIGSVSQINRARSAVVRFVPEAMRIDRVRELGRYAAPGGTTDAAGSGAGREFGSAKHLSGPGSAGGRSRIPNR